MHDPPGKTKQQLETNDFDSGGEATMHLITSKGDLMQRKVKRCISPLPGFKIFVRKTTAVIQEKYCHVPSPRVI